MKKLFTLSAAMVLLMGCSHVKGSFRTVEGRAFDLENVELVRTGMTMKEVTSLIGPPFEASEKGDDTLHRYYMVREKIDKDKALGVVAVEKKTVETYELLLTYRNGVVTNKRFTRLVDKPEEKEKQPEQI